jgi:glycosyltransferase involved in cell wall biosynthesis
VKYTIGLPIIKVNFLAETLDSIAKQTFGDYELIIRNNGLTQEIKENIKSICSDWLEKPNVIYTESKEQLAIADNFNEIVKIANGEYITLLSDDDIIDPDFLKEFDYLIQGHQQADVYHCRVRIVNQEGELVHYSELCPEFENLPDFLYHRLIGVRLIYLSDFVVSTKALKAIGGFPKKSKGWGVDTLTWHLLGDNGFAYTPKTLLDYRVNSANFTNNPNNLIKKLIDLSFLKNEKDRIIKSDEFRKQSMYPIKFLLEKNIERFKSDSREILSDICQANNLFRFYKYYKQYKEKHYFTRSLLFKLLLKKLFLENY